MLLIADGLIIAEPNHTTDDTARQLRDLLFDEKSLACYTPITWTVDDEKVMRELSAARVSGIFTDYPQWSRPLVEACQ
jgi:glycerophosphoryl diester phosphodiesterase